MIKMDVSIDIRKLGKVTPQTTNALAGGLYREGQNIRTGSMRRTPVETGNLRAAHYVTEPVIHGSIITVEVGNTAEYARHVHERLDLNHAVGEAKFLERTLNERVPVFTQKIAAEIIPTLARF